MTPFAHWATFVNRACDKASKGGRMVWARVGIVLVALLANSVAIAQSADAGAQIYEENCATCHGERLRPTGAAPDLKKLTADRKDFFEKMVNDGKGQMPAWGGVITDEQREAIWAYIRSRAG